MYSKKISCIPSYYLYFYTTPANPHNATYELYLTTVKILFIKKNGQIDKDPKTHSFPIHAAASLILPA